MAKDMIKESIKTVHKLVVEGTYSINTDNSIVFDIPEEGLKKLHDLSKNFSGQYVKLTLQTEEQKDIE